MAPAAFLTGSGANLLAAALIGGAIGGNIIFLADWMMAMFPVMLIIMLFGYIIGDENIFSAFTMQNVYRR
ncbi:MAG: hypothetical protein MZV65_43780 [Chromatiales bacterium]|nr:hypothetical protein [Chromatiales bacterium]